MTLPPVMYQVLGWAFVVVAPVTPIFIVALSVHNYRRTRNDFETARFKAMAAILIWLVVTLAMIFMLAFVTYIIGHSLSQNPSVQPRPSLTYVAVHVIYFAVCYLLIDWVGRRRRVPSGAT